MLKNLILIVSIITSSLGLQAMEDGFKTLSTKEAQESPTIKAMFRSIHKYSQLRCGWSDEFAMEKGEDFTIFKATFSNPYQGSVEPAQTVLRMVSNTGHFIQISLMPAYECPLGHGDYTTHISKKINSSLGFPNGEIIDGWPECELKSVSANFSQQAIMRFNQVKRNL